MREVVKRVSLTQPAPIQIDSTEPDVIEHGARADPRAARSSTRSTSRPGRDKLDVVVPLRRRARRRADRADDRRGRDGQDARAQARDRAAHPRARATAHGLDRELLIFDALTFTLTTGDDEWKPSAVETIEGIRRIKAELPGVLDVARRLERVLRRLARRARGPQLRLPAPLRRGRARPGDGQPEPHHAVRRDRRRRARRSPTTSSSTGARTRSSASSSTSRARAPRRRPRRPAIPTEGMEPEEALHFHILRRKKDGVEDWIDRSVEKIGAVPTLNDVLLPAMKEVGDKFGAGELILPFVLQSAEVMKRAVARLENYLDRIEGYTKGTVVLATVFGDVHDIGKSLVNTILTNNGYTVVDLGKQVPIGTIIDAAKEHDATAIGLSALLVSTSKQMPLVRPGAPRARLRFPVLIGGAAINRDFGLRALYPRGLDSDDALRRPASSTARTPSRAWPRWTSSSTSEARAALVDQDARRGRAAARQGRRARAGRRHRRRRVRSAARDRHAGAGAAVVGRARGRRRPRRGLPPPRHARALQAPLGRARREGRGLAQARATSDFRPRLERMWREADYLHPRAPLGYFPCYAEGNEVVVLDPEDRRRSSSASSSRASRSTTASAWPTSSARGTATSSTSSRCRR